MSYDRWKTRAPDLDGPEEPSLEQQRADYEDERQQKTSPFCDFYGKWCGDCERAGHCLANPPEGK